jgi:hypothetical protein
MLGQSSGWNLKQKRQLYGEFIHGNPRNQSQAVTQEVKSEAGFGVGRYGVGGFGVGEEEITITLNDGSVFGAIDFASQVIAAWQNFFTQHQV